MGALTRNVLIITLNMFSLPKRKSLGKPIQPNPVYTYLLKVNNRNTRKRCEMCSKLTIKTPERRQ